MLSVETNEMCRNNNLPGGTGLRRGGFSMRKKTCYSGGRGRCERTSRNCWSSFEQGNEPPQPTLGPDSAPCLCPAAPGSSTLPPWPGRGSRKNEKGEKKIFLVVHCEHVSEHVVQAEIICEPCCVVTDGNGVMKQALPVAATLRLGAGPHVEEASPGDCSVTCWRRGSLGLASSCLLLWLTDVLIFLKQFLAQFQLFFFFFFCKKQPNWAAKMSFMDVEKLKMTGAGRAMAVLTSGGDAQGHYEVNQIELKSLKTHEVVSFCSCDFVCIVSKNACCVWVFFLLRRDVLNPVKVSVLVKGRVDARYQL